MHVDLLLWEGNGDTFLVETLFDGLLEVEEHTRVVFLLAPGPHAEIHAVVGKLTYYE
jgi:hypothetical protein